MRSNAWTVLAAIAAVIIPYLLTQSDVSIPPVVKVGLTAANLALVVVSKLSGTAPVPVGDAGSQAQTTSGEAATIEPTEETSDVERTELAVGASSDHPSARTTLPRRD